MYTYDNVTDTNALVAVNHVNKESAFIDFMNILSHMESPLNWLFWIQSSSLFAAPR
jgi:1-acyl-sn-glycerol-3-phosphate acyltransferase